MMKRRSLHPNRREMPTRTFFICARTRSPTTPIACLRITRQLSSFTRRQSNLTQISHSLMRDSHLFVLKSSVIMNQPTVGEQKLTPKRKLPFRLSQKHIPHDITPPPLSRV